MSYKKLTKELENESIDNKEKIKVEKSLAFVKSGKIIARKDFLID